MRGLRTMGRYYNGDIEGKFWFGVQSSDDADFFGVTGQTPDELEYYFSKEDLDKVNQGVKECEDHLGDFKEKLDKFFEEEDGYTDEMLAKALEVTHEHAKNLLEWYARLNLGLKIKECIVKKGDCNFTAEC